MHNSEKIQKHTQINKKNTLQIAKHLFCTRVHTCPPGCPNTCPNIKVTNILINKYQIQTTNTIHDNNNTNTQPTNIETTESITTNNNPFKIQAIRDYKIKSTKEKLGNTKYIPLLMTHK